MQDEPRHRPQGAIRDAGARSALARVGTVDPGPLSGDVAAGTIAGETAMEREGSGYFVHREREAVEGLRYAFRFPDGSEYPDPASRWQPDGVHRPSAVFFPGAVPLVRRRTGGACPAKTW